MKEPATKLLIDQEQYQTIIHLFNCSVEDGRYEQHQFNDLIEMILNYGLMIESFIISGRCSPDVFDNVPDVVITTRREMFSEN